MENLIQETLLANLDLPKHQLVIFTWGNVSTINRAKGLVAIKPSGIPYDQLEARHIVVVDLKGKVVSGTYRPSIDTATHLEIYRRFSSVSGIAHTYSRWATIWAQSGLDIPVLGTTHADYFYGDIPCTRKLTADETSSEYELNTGKVIAETFENRKINPATVPGVLVASRGPFSWGGSAAEAVYHAVVLEECAMMAYHTRMLRADLPEIDQNLQDRHYQRRHGKTAYYGQKRG